MIFSNVESPEAIAPAALDEYLSKGWFRMGQTLFTTNFLCFNDRFYSAIWLRIGLPAYHCDKTDSRLSRLNARFRTEITKAQVTQEKEVLFARYRSNVPFQASASLRHLMQGKADGNVFDTFEVNVYDGTKLIACGFFDVGENAAAGISSFYDPDYKKFSLGKYVIYVKIRHCKALGLQYFYPGYFVPGYSFFDYKLSIGRQSLEYLSFAKGEWCPVETFKAEASPYPAMNERLQTLKKMLADAGISTALLKYEFFDANLMPELRGAALFDYPVFLYFNQTTSDEFLHVVVYNVTDQCYDLVLCRCVWKIKTARQRDDMYSENLLKPIEQHTIAMKPQDAARWIRINKV